ncbi:hypothetical protein CROQUDRAFT_652823 [Cronartium quercuum f. sp. fusiforme G11]|uniref:Protein phosphatase 1 regulatory subunit 7 n=1 Tax=Cronartium quercuum f. sp. fusiforme G11 TaxID=708437 RepID=A0A9P6NTK1_9BASI|nr:hypothetical protein CROQUDRAFT_652823 [Cronartium quercuum f. sp. fusiforme G11]
MSERVASPDLSDHETPATNAPATDKELLWAAENEELLEEFKTGTEELELLHARIRTLRGFEKHLARLAPSLKKVNLRQNLIGSLSVPTQLEPKIVELADGGDQAEVKPKAEAVEAEVHYPLEMLTNLEELDLYDNQLAKIEGLTGLSALQSLDLSFNLLRKIANLETLTSLKILYLIQNKISAIEGLEHLAATLTSVELGSNRIRRISNLSALTNLTELWLGRNKIIKLEGLSTLVNLKTLSIQSNRIVQLEGLEGLFQLEELYISHNGLAKIGDGLAKNVNLRVLDIASNRIDDLSGIECLTKLEELWANNNQLQVSAFHAIAPALSEASMPDLTTVYLEGNPLQAEMGANYRRKIKLACPQITQIDATFAK